MVSVTLPCSSASPNYSFDTTLDGVTYEFAFAWNEAAQAWFMAIADANGEPLVSGVRVVVRFPLALRETNPALPPGVFLAVDTSRQDLDPGLEDFGTRVQLLYFSAASSDG